MCDNCFDKLDIDIELDGAFGVLEAQAVEAVVPVSTKLTQLETFELYQQGLDIEAMAQTRNLKPATIVEHLIFLINAKMAVDVRRFVTEEIEQRIIDAVQKVGKGRLIPIKEELGDEIGWNEIKLVMAKIA